MIVRRVIAGRPIVREVEASPARSLPMFAIPLPIGIGQAVDRRRVTQPGLPCSYCGAAGSCDHREALPAVEVRVKLDPREITRATGGGGNYRRRKRGGGLV